MDGGNDGSISDSSAFTGNWQSDDEPPTDKVGDLLPLAVVAGRVVLLKKILQLGNSHVNSGDEDAISIKLVPAHADTDITNDSALLQQLDCQPEERCLVSDLRVRYPEIVQALRFMKLGESALIFKEADWKVTLPTKKDAKRLETYRREFVKLQSEEATFDRTRRRLARHLQPFALVRFEQMESRQAILDSNAVRITIRKTTTWQLAQEDSVILLKLWNGDSTMHYTYSQVRELPYETLRVTIADTENASLKNLLRSLRVGEACRVEWNGQQPRFGHTDVCYLEMTSFETSVRYLCYNDTDTELHESRGSGCLKELRDGEIGDDQAAANICELRTLHSMDSEADWLLMRSTGIVNAEDGSCLVIRLGKDHFAFVLYRSQAFPLWFHEIVQKMRTNYTYTMTLSADVTLPSPQQSTLDRCVSDPAFQRLLAYIERSDRSTPTASIEPPSGGSVDVDETGQQISDPSTNVVMMLNPLHRSFATAQNSPVYMPALNQVYKISIPETLAEYNETGSLEKCAVLDQPLCLKAGTVYDVAFLGDISSELTPWDDNLTGCFSNAIKLLANAQTLQSQRPLFFTKLCQDATDYVRHLVARKLEDADIEALHDFVQTVGCASGLEKIRPEVIPTIKSLCPRLYHVLNNTAAYLTALRARRVGGDTRAENRHIIAAVERLVDAEEATPQLHQRCRVLKAAALLAQNEYAACIDFCEAAAGGEPEIERLKEQALKLHAKDEELARSMYKRMFA